VVGFEGVGSAMQKGEVLFTQKTSRQQAVTPRLGGRLVKAEAKGRGEEEDLGGPWDWRRTRTTSRGVTVVEQVRPSLYVAVEDAYRGVK